MISFSEEAMYVFNEKKNKKTKQALKPLTWLLSRSNHQWNASTSLIEAFAIFILLSYVKVINTSF